MSVEDRYLDDLSVGEQWTSPPILVDRHEAEAFARRYDPQPIHLAPEAAICTFDGVSVSGWFVCALAMRDFATSRPFGTTMIFGMGIDELRWEEPVLPDDMLTVERRIVETRPLRSRPGQGLARMEVRVLNQRAVLVLRFLETIGIPIRPGADI